ncbi:MAG: DUF2062 domain-containing protein [Phycisphaerales bacterium]|nr:DUF2062 domain-containing protein [Phycisphaerales bacterium]MBT7171046.1 DUF2062 domain-containing protein [Phycisphaerales bacterium]
MSLRMIRKIGEIVRGGGSLRDVSLGMFLGFTLGMVPGVNLTAALLIFLVVLLNCNIGAVFLAMMLGAGTSYIAVEPLHSLGQWLIHDAGLAPLLTQVGETPVLAFLDWENYCVFSGLLTGLAGGFVLAVVFAFLVGSIRQGVVNRRKKSEKMDRAAENRFVRIFLWIFFGGRKGTLEDSLNKRSPLLRRSGAVVILILIGLFVGGAWYVANVNVTPYAKDGLERVNGAEVNITDLALSLHGGSISMDGVQLTKNSEPIRNRFAIGKVGMDMSFLSLLKKQIVVDRVECLNLTIDTKRASEGIVYTLESFFPDFDFDLEDAENAEDPLTTILGYIEQAEQLNEYWKEVQGMMGDEKTPEELAKEDAEKKENSRVAWYRSQTAYSQLHTKTPAWLVREVEIDVHLVDVFPALKVKMTNLSSDAKIAGEPVFEVYPDPEGLDAFLVTKFGEKYKGLGTAIVPMWRTLTDPKATDAEKSDAVGKLVLKFAAGKGLEILKDKVGDTLKDKIGDELGDKLGEDLKKGVGGLLDGFGGKKDE